MTSTIVRIVLLAAVAWLAAACAEITPVDYTSISDIPPGPGLFSGDDGEFTLFRHYSVEP